MTPLIDRDEHWLEDHPEVLGDQIDEAEYRMRAPEPVDGEVHMPEGVRIHGETTLLEHADYLEAEIARASAVLCTEIEKGNIESLRQVFAKLADIGIYAKARRR